MWFRHQPSAVGLLTIPIKNGSRWAKKFHGLKPGGKKLGSAGTRLIPPSAAIRQAKGLDKSAVEAMQAGPAGKRYAIRHYSLT
jgi:hypothetical protein